MPVYSAQARGVDKWVLSRWEETDRNNDGEVTLDEFGGPEDVFNRYDWDGNGIITENELPHQMNKHALVMVRENLQDEAVLERDVTFGRGGNRDLQMDYLYLKSAPKPMPVLVWIHGGAWQEGGRMNGAELLLPFARRGFFCVTIEYRLTHEAPYPAQIEDCKCAIRFLRAHAQELGVDPDRIGVWGSSAGGHLAALLGTTADVKELEGEGGWPEQSSRVAAVCNWFGPADLRAESLTVPAGIHEAALRKLLGGAVSDRAELAALASPLVHVTPDDAPFIIVHGTDDPVVPYEQSVQLAKALEEAGVPVKFIRVKHGEHGGAPFRAAKVRRKVYGFLIQYLGQ